MTEEMRWRKSSGFEIAATALPLWFMSASETVMANATLSVFFWVVLSVRESATAPPPLLLLPPLFPSGCSRDSLIKNIKKSVLYRFKCTSAGSRVFRVVVVAVLYGA